MAGRNPSLLRIVVLTATVLAVFLVAAVGVSAALTPACGACHPKEASALRAQASGHAGLSCPRCHVKGDPVSRVAFGLDQVFGMALRIEPLNDRGRGGVPKSTCSGCHPDLKGITASGRFKIKHSKCAVGMKCTDCHSGVAHGSTVLWRRTSDMSACIACHMEHRGPVGCGTCHDGQSMRLRLRTGSLWVLHDKDWRKTHPMGNLDVCGACHKRDFCGRCHGAGVPHGPSFRIDHAAIFQQPDAKCFSCHKQRYCDKCHQIQMPHPAGFPKEHAKVVRARGRQLCKSCHEDSDCVTCHVMHVHPGGAI